MKNIIATSKTTDLIIQITYIDDFIIKGQVLVADKYNHIGKIDFWSTSTFNISKKETKQENNPLELYSSYELEKWRKEGKDPIVQKVVDKFQERSKVGIQKYGTTLEENNTDDFLTHLQEELFDASLYIEKLKEQKDTYFELLGKYNELKGQFKSLQTQEFDVQNAIDELQKLGYIVGLKM